MDRRARGDEARRARAAYVPAPAFTLVTDEYVSTHDGFATSTVPRLQAMPSPRATNVSKYWFNPSWITENERPDVDHGEFQSPVWLAVEMTMRSDRDRDRDREAVASGTPRHGRHAAEDIGNGQLRSMLALVSGAKHAGATSNAPITYLNPGTTCDKAVTAPRYHELPPRPARQAGKFVRFISSNLGRVSVNHN
jgi:hypothetical protein